MKRVLWFIAPFLLWMACQKDIEFDYHDAPPQLVIEGRVSEVGTTVALTQTLPMGEPMIPRYLTDARVRIHDLTAGDSRELLPNDEGIYLDAVAGELGHEYRIEVSREGKSYSSSAVMRPPTEILDLSFRWIKMPYDYVAILYVSFLDPPSQDDCYWIKIYRNGKPYRWILSDDRRAVAGMIGEVTMTSRRDIAEEEEKFVLKDGDEVKVAVTPISREMHNYLTALRTGSNGSRMFEGDYCLGYFLPSVDVHSSIVFRPDEMETIE